MVSIPSPMNSFHTSRPYLFQANFNIN
jgi:hypothetical protein